MGVLPPFERRIMRSRLGCSPHRSRRSRSRRSDECDRRLPDRLAGHRPRPSAGLVVNEVYGGGGNSGATYTNDFIELANRGSAPIDLSGYSVQYHSGSATGAWQATPLSGSLAPGALYLVQESQGAGGTTALPTPDATGTIALSATSGTVALVSSTTALTCADSAACEAASVDLVGYGTAALAETSPVAGASNTALGAAHRRRGHRPQRRRLRRRRADATGRQRPRNPDRPEPADARPPAHPRPPGRELDLAAERADGHERAGHRHRRAPDAAAAAATGCRTRRADSNPATSEGVFVYTGTAPDRRRRRLGARQRDREGLLPARIRRHHRDDLEPVGDRARESDRLGRCRTATRSRRRSCSRRRPSPTCTHPTWAARTSSRPRSRRRVRRSTSTSRSRGCASRSTTPVSSVRPTASASST